MNNNSEFMPVECLNVPKVLFYDKQYEDLSMDAKLIYGHQATKAIRALGIERSDAVTIPIIALSANALIDDIQESLDSGMNDHISKPINMEEVTDTIAKYIKDDTCLEKELKQKQNDR